MSVTEELIQNLSETLVKKDKQVEELAAERDRLREVVKGYQKQHEEDTRRITELLLDNLELNNKLREAK